MEQITGETNDEVDEESYLTKQGLISCLYYHTNELVYTWLFLHIYKKRN